MVMRICMRVADVIEQEVVAWLERVVLAVEQICHDVVEQIESWHREWEERWEQQTRRVCRWLPWPLSTLCDWVTEWVKMLVEVWVKVVTSVVRTVCQIVTSVIRSFVRVVTTIFVTILRIVCFTVGFFLSWIDIIVSAVAGLPEFLSCMLGLRIRKHLHICVTVLADRRGRPVVDDAKVSAVVSDAAAIISKRTNVNVHEHGRKVVRVDQENLTVVGCNAKQLLEGDAVMLSGEQEHVGKFSDLFGCSEDPLDQAGELLQGILNVIFIADIVEGDDIGCHIPGTDYVIIDTSAGGMTLAHEIGHAGDLWHVDDEKNLMNHFTSGDEVERWQACIFRRSRFVHYAP
jgi:hypothetical protein